MSAKSFFSETQRGSVVRAITNAEAMTSGEIRVHVEPTCGAESAMNRAAEVFRILKMDNTAHGTGVLIYIAYEDRKFAIIGDKGINEAVPSGFWDNVKNEMQYYFSKGAFFEGVVFAIEQAGGQLKHYFPVAADDKNELSNDISEA